VLLPVAPLGMAVLQHAVGLDATPLGAGGACKVADAGDACPGSSEPSSPAAPSCSEPTDWPLSGSLSETEDELDMPDDKDAKRRRCQHDRHDGGAGGGSAPPGGGGGGGGT
jgi:hypothetical protein